GQLSLDSMNTAEFIESI
ncbi:hypothetical protein A2U01_0066800, partial [Trifolium medium]|nr:hypothetical protein [Trifolium medium]